MCAKSNVKKITRNDLIEYYNRCITFNLLSGDDFVEYGKYRYKVVGKEIWLKDIISKITKTLIIEPVFDVWDVYWLDDLNNKVRVLDLGSITKLNQGFDGSDLEIVYANHVKKIPSECFYECQNLKELHIENCISIGESAFDRCELTELHADKVKYVGNSAFSESAMRKLYLGNTSFVEYSFANMYVLEELKMKSCNYIGLGTNLFMDTRRIKYLDLGVFNDSKHHFYIVKESDVYKYHRDKLSLEWDNKCYELLYGKVKSGYIAIRNSEIDYTKLYNKVEIHLELSKDIVEKGLTDYYLYYWGKRVKRTGISQMFIKAGNQSFNI